jgi:hypothetical protein
VTVGEFGWTTIGAEKTSTGYEVALKYAATGQYTVWNTDSNGNVTYDPLGGPASGSSTALENYETSFLQDLNGDGVIGIPSAQSSVFATNAPISVAAGATVEVSTPYGGQATFNASSGTLRLDDSSSFFGTVAGMAAQDAIDFADINFATLQQASFSGNSSSGTLSVSDGTHAANIALLGGYMASTFVTSSDGHGGTYVVAQSSTNTNALLAQPHA